jgi:hypothetical protein
MGHHCLAGLADGFFELFELERASVSLGSSDFCDKSAVELGTGPIAELGTWPPVELGTMVDSWSVS